LVTGRPLKIVSNDSLALPAISGPDRLTQFDLATESSQWKIPLDSLMAAFGRLSKRQPLASPRNPLAVRADDDSEKGGVKEMIHLFNNCGLSSLSAGRTRLARGGSRRFAT
jgi:hypothetical protein